MAEIDSRARLLIDMLMARGYGWLAAEIVDAIELGTNNTDDLDLDVAAQRKALYERMDSGDLSEKSSPQELKVSAMHVKGVPERVTGNGQVNLAVKIMVDRLASAAEMTSQNVDELVNLTGAPVELAVETDDGIRHILPHQARAAASLLRKVEHEFITWLISTSSEDES